jgi:hypothetical protein
MPNPPTWRQEFETTCRAKGFQPEEVAELRLWPLDQGGMVVLTKLRDGGVSKSTITDPQAWPSYLAALPLPVMGLDAAEVAWVRLDGEGGDFHLRERE